MQALILAAGRGNRMRPLTDSTHKTLLTVGGRTLIEWIVDSLHASGVTDITVVTGYLEEDVRRFLEERYHDHVFQFIHNARWDETNNIYSMALALDEMALDQDVLLIESDLVFEPDVVRRILASPHDNVALVDRFSSGMDGTVVELQGGVIANVIPPHLQGPAFDFSSKFKTLNIYKFSTRFCSTTFRQLLTYYAKVIDDNCYYESILGMLIYMQRETIHAEVVEGLRWAELDDPNDFSVASFIFDPPRQQQILVDTFGGYWNYGILDFAFLRNMYFPNSSILAEMRNNLPMLLHNYGSRQSILDQKLGYVLLLDPTRLLALNGASQAYPLLQEYAADRDMLIPAPTFGEYARVFPSAATYADNAGVDLADVERRARVCHGTVFVNPNNPTGTTLASSWIHAFAKRNPSKLVIMDESLLDFSSEPSVISLLAKDPLQNVVVVKSLSKAYGVPGLRLGFVYTHDAAFLRFARARVPIWNMNSLAEFFLEIMLKHRLSLADSIRQTIRDRGEFALLLAQLPCVAEVHEGGGNFLLVRLRIQGEAGPALVRAMLADQKIYVKDVSDRLSSGDLCLRVAVRLPAENARFAEALQAGVEQIQAGRVRVRQVPA